MFPSLLESRLAIFLSFDSVVLDIVDAAATAPADTTGGVDADSIENARAADHYFTKEPPVGVRNRGDGALTRRPPCKLNSAPAWCEC